MSREELIAELNEALENLDMFDLDQSNAYGDDHFEAEMLVDSLMEELDNG